ncbi:MAG: hypothetical protein AB1Z98_24975 [Nannocystaceae bacterium]
MSSILGGRRSVFLIFGLLGPVACFNPADERPAEAEDDGGSSSGGLTEEGEESTSDDGAPPAQDPCPEYCEIIGDHCGDDLAQYPGQAICEAVCALMDPGEEGDVLGNSAACRAHHAFLAAESADPHCLHGGPTGDTTCGGPCESFCSLARDACPDELSPFLDTDECIAECESWPPQPKYFAGVEAGDSYACRMHHLTLAALQPDVHCGHIGTDSPVCADE